MIFVFLCLLVYLFVFSNQDCPVVGGSSGGVVVSKMKKFNKYIVELSTQKQYINGHQVLSIYIYSL